MAHIPAERCLEIIELLADGAREMPLRDVAEWLDLPKSGVHRMLVTLVERGWAAQDPVTGFYRLTMHLAVLGQKFYAATGVADACQPLLDRLASDSREFVRLAVYDGHALVWIAHAQGAVGNVGLVYQPADTSGDVPLHATASGKAWLASLTQEQAVRFVLREGGFERAERFGPKVVRTVEALLEDLKLTRARGYGLAVEEAEPGVTAIGAAIHGASAAPSVGTVSVAGPTVRMTASRIDELAPLVIACAEKLSELWPLRLKRPGSQAAGSPPSAVDADALSL